jgi:hypothetical protein
MNQDEFRRKIELLAKVVWRDQTQPSATGRSYRLMTDTGPGATIKQLHLTPVKCPDCDIICTQKPRRDFFKKTYGWIEKCRECGLWRNDDAKFGALPYKKSGTVIKRSIDLKTTQLNSTTHQLLPIEHDANDSLIDPVDDQDHDEDLESDS